jgi:hypothetical protein
MSCLRYSYFRPQFILTQHSDVAKPIFLHTSFVFQSNENQNTDNEIMIGDIRLHPMLFSHSLSFFVSFHLYSTIRIERN